ncbi:MAG: hypothetical protein AAF485_29905 [Chloroflexota bacterium]
MAIQQSNPEKEELIGLVNCWLERSGLTIKQVIARMQVRGCNALRTTFENRFTTRLDQKPNVPPEWTLGVVAAFTERLTDKERCRADEAIDFARLTRLPINQVFMLREFFPPFEFDQALNAYIMPQSTSHK